MAIDSKSAIYISNKDDNGWAKLNMSLPLMLQYYHNLGGNQLALLMYFINRYNNAATTCQEEAQRQIAMSCDDIAYYMGITKKTAYNSLQSLLDKGLIKRVNKEVFNVTTESNKRGKSPDRRNMKKGRVLEYDYLDNDTTEIRKGRDKARYVPNWKLLRKQLCEYLDKFPEIAY